jgi:hypothetical protein
MNAYLQITELIGMGTELTSLLLIVASFLIVAFLAYRTKTIRSLQFEMFIVLLIIMAAEVPKILSSLGLVSISGIEDVGLVVHTTSMVFLCAFITLRASRYFRGRAS